LRREAVKEGGAVEEGRRLKRVAVEK